MGKVNSPESLHKVDGGPEIPELTYHAEQLLLYNYGEKYEGTSQLYHRIANGWIIAVSVLSFPLCLLAICGE